MNILNLVAAVCAGALFILSLANPEYIVNDFSYRVAAAMWCTSQLELFFRNSIDR